MLDRIRQKADYTKPIISRELQPEQRRVWMDEHYTKPIISRELQH